MLWQRCCKFVLSAYTNVRCISNIKEILSFEHSNYIQFFKGKHHIKNDILNKINRIKPAPLINIDCVDDDLYVGTRGSQFLTIHRKSLKNDASSIEMVFNARKLNEKAHGSTLISAKPSANGELLAFCFEGSTSENKLLGLRHIKSGNWMVVRFPKEVEAEFPFGVSSIEWFEPQEKESLFPLTSQYSNHSLDCKLGGLLIVSLSDKDLRASALAYVGIPMFWDEGQVCNLWPTGKLERVKSSFASKSKSSSMNVPFLLHDGDDCDAMWFGIVKRENDPTMFLDVNKTKDSSFIILTTSSKTSSSVELIDRRLSREGARSLIMSGEIKPVLLNEREPRARQYADCGNNVLVALKAKDSRSPDLQLCFARMQSNSTTIGDFVESESWKKLKSNFAIIDIDFLHEAIIAYCRDITGVLGQGAGQECVLISKRDHQCTNISDHATSFRHVRQIPIGASVTAGANCSYYSSSFLLSYSTPVSQEIFAEFDCQSGKLLGLLPNEHDFVAKLSEKSSILRVASGMCKKIIQHKIGLSSKRGTSLISKMAKSSEPLSNTQINDEQNLVIFRLSGPSNDGSCSIPITCAMNKKLHDEWKNGKKLNLRVAVHVYGSYGSCIDTDFKEYYVPLIEQGWMIAFCHIRGGGELGRQWYLDGASTNKQNSIEDVLSSCEYLCQQNLTSRESQRIAIIGSSAGAVVVGQAINLCPELFGAAVMSSPFVDVLSAMQDQSACLTKVEYEEWGNPENEKELRVIRAISPRQNIRSQKYPPVMLTVGLMDPRINAQHVLSYAEELRQANSNNLVVVDVEEGDGHSGPSHVKGVLEHMAYMCTFLNICIPN